MPNANDNSDAGAIGRSFAVEGHETRLPSLSSLITGPDPEREFATLIQRLVAHQGRIQGSEIQPSSIPGVSIAARGGILGLNGPLVIWPAWSLQDPANQHAELRRLQELTASYQYGPIGMPGDLVLVLSIELDAQARQCLKETIQPAAGALHPVGAAEWLGWLRACPPLLARYLPEEAARRADSQGLAPTPFAGWLGQFAPRLVNSLRDLQLFGFPPARRPPGLASGECSPRSFKLDQVFVPQNLHRLGGPARETQTLGSLRTQPGPFVLLGDPGSGKTSILRYLAGTWAGQHQPSADCPVRRVPLFLPLREYAKLRGSDPHVPLVTALCQHAARAASLERGDPHPWRVEALLEMGEAVVLFDGLDEAGGPDARRDLARLVAGFHEQYPLCPLWLTSREVGYAYAAQELKSFAHYKVAPFTLPQQRAFVELWFGAQLPRSEHECERKDRTLSLLKALSDAAAPIREMAGNPLLLTLMAWVHHDFGRLPHTQGELYDEFIKMMLHRRDEARFEGDPGELEGLIPPVNHVQARQYYAEIAFAAQQLNEGLPEPDARSVIPQPEVLRILKQRRRQHLVNYLPDTLDAVDLDQQVADQVTRFLDHADERHGLLRRRDDTTWAFLHLSFQEHLAAAWKAGGKRDRHAIAEFLIEKAPLASWHLTLVLLLHHLRDFDDQDDGRSFNDFLVEHALSRPPDSVGLPFWEVLGKALRDDRFNRFSLRHQRLVLDRLIGACVVNGTFTGTTVAVLQTLADWDELHRPLLLDRLASAWSGADPASAVVALHLRVHLLGWPHGSREESDWLGEQLLKHLPAVDPPDKARPIIERAAQLLLDAKPGLFRDASPGEQCVRTVQERYMALMFDSRLPIAERATVAGGLCRLGDPRHGVGLGAGYVPEFDWIALPPGKFELGKTGRPVEVTAFRISRYPVTVAQFRAFLDDAEGYHHKEHWRREDLPEMLDWWRENHERGPENYAPVFQTPNHPRVGVCWYEAVAFCRWLSRKRGLDPDGPDAIRLPHEAEWEWAARCNIATGQAFALEERPYPWGGPKPREDVKEHLSQHCNWEGTGIRHTSAVGLFPNGKADCGALDLTGNVWEWCENENEGYGGRVLRGGAWFDDFPPYLSSAYRRGSDPGCRYVDFGFRCVVVGLGAARR